LARSLLEVEDVEAAGRPADRSGRRDVAAGVGGFVRAEGAKLALGGLKRAEDGRGAILRPYEPHGAGGRYALRFALPVERAERTNLLEGPKGPVEGV
jgi:alpha-mannosidase